MSGTRGGLRGAHPAGWALVVGSALAAAGCLDTPTGGRPGGGACADDSQCTDGDACNVAACVGGVCEVTAKPDDVSCGCYASCQSGECVQAALAGCSDDSACDDGDPCTVDTCDGCDCAWAPVDDGAACGECGETCYGGSCIVPPTLPPECEQDGDCVEAPPCTAGVCVVDGPCHSDATCVYEPVPGCLPCVDDADCPPSGDPCAVAACVDGLCGGIAAADGTPCGRCGLVCSGGECEGPAPECASDPDCPPPPPDGCTASFCDEETCQCLMEDIPGCGEAPCELWGCQEEADAPCVAAACGPDGTCWTATWPSCVSPSCDPEDATSVAEAVAGPAPADGQALTLVGVPAPGPPGGCTKLGCTEENPCCNTCSAELRLEASKGAAAIAMLGGPDPVYVGCETDECGGVKACFPFPAGQGAPDQVVAWGTAMASPSSGAGSPGWGLVVDGWCAVASGADHEGVFEGLLEFADGPVGAPTPVRLTLTPPGADETAWMGTLEPNSPCSACLPVEPQDLAEVQVEAFGVSFWATLTGPYGQTETLLVELAVAAGDRLVGGFGPGFTSTLALVPPLPPTWGTVALEAVEATD